MGGWQGCPLLVRYVTKQLSKIRVKFPSDNQFVGVNKPPRQFQKCCKMQRFSAHQHPIIETLYPLSIFSRVFSPVVKTVNHFNSYDQSCHWLSFPIHLSLCRHNNQFRVFTGNPHKRSSCLHVS